MLSRGETGQMKTVLLDLHLLVGDLDRIKYRILSGGFQSPLLGPYWPHS